MVELGMTPFERDSWLTHIVENRLKWFGHVERRLVDDVVRVDQMEGGRESDQKR